MEKSALIVTLLFTSLVILIASQDPQIDFFPKNEEVIISSKPVFQGSKGNIFLFSDQHNRLFPVDLESGQIVQDISLREIPGDIVPTPGGVALFVYYQQGGTIDIFDALTFEKKNTIHTGWENIQSLTFSPNGDRVFLQVNNGNKGVRYLHNKLNLTSPIVADIQTPPGALFSDKRGNRIYLSSVDQVNILFAKTMESIEKLPLSGRGLFFEDSYNYLWGTNPQNQIQLWDLRGEDLKTFKESSSTPGVQQEDRILFLSDTGGEVLFFKKGSKASPRQKPLPLVGSLLLPVSQGSTWILGQKGGVVQLRGTEVIASWTILNRTDQSWNKGVSALVQTEGSFACF